MGICGNNIQKANIELDEKITEQVSEFKYLGNTICFDNTFIEFKVQTYNKIHGIIRPSFRKQIFTETQLRLHNTTPKPDLTFGSGKWILKQKDRHKIETAETSFLRPLIKHTSLGPYE
jgi:hypothetical protein